MNEDGLKKGPSFLLCTFIYGSLILLLACLSAVSFFFSNTYLKKEKVRAESFSEMLAESFELQYRPITEEMWTHSYESIHMRIQEIAKNLSKSEYSLVLADGHGNCVYSSDQEKQNALNLTQTPLLYPSRAPVCIVPSQLKRQIPLFHSELVEPFFDFDSNLNRYVYMVPLYVGTALQGYLFVSLTDPYQFYRGTHLSLVFKVFFLPFSIILFVWLTWLVVSYSYILKPYLTMLIRMKKKEALANLALQVAHDIRSPSVALNSVAKNLSGIGQAQRKILNLAASRVENIANDLLNQFGSTFKKEGAFCFLSVVIDAIVSEKRAVLGTSSKIEIETLLSDEIQCTGIPISETEFLRVLSNLLNNAIESLERAEIAAPLIRIEGKLLDDRVSLTIDDNGPGIPADILHLIRTSGGTYGKTGGSGLGLKHAKDVIAGARGSLRIDSTVGVGTRVVLDLPITSTPSWCAKVLDFSDAKMIIVLDDDESVHALWKQRLGNLPVQYFADSKQLRISEYPPAHCKYLIDYDLGKDCQSGLEVIAQCDLGSRAILCTSNFGDPSIQMRCEELGAQILPKFMLSTVPIVWPRVTESTELKSAVASSVSNGANDLILIDDDPLIRELWEFDAAQVGKRIITVGSLTSLDWNSIVRTIPIFIDKNLGEGASGLEVAQELHERGFQNIFLTTGENMAGAEVPDFISGVQNKDFPMSLKGF